MEWHLYPIYSNKRKKEIDRRMVANGYVISDKLMMTSQCCIEMLWALTQKKNNKNRIINM